MKDYISMDDWILLKGQQIIVPSVLQNDILYQLHNHSHQGIKMIRLLARRCIYWPGVNDDIAAVVGNCTICNMFQNSQPAEPMYERILPSGP